MGKSQASPLGCSSVMDQGDTLMSRHTNVVLQSFFTPHLQVYLVACMEAVCVELPLIVLACWVGCRKCVGWAATSGASTGHLKRSCIVRLIRRR